MTLNSRATIVLACIIAATMPLAAAETLPQLAQRLGQREIYLPRVAEIVPTELSALRSQSDLIVTARVTEIRTYLSDDQRSILTEYQVSPTRVILQKNVQPARVPGMPPSIVLTRWGGTMQIAGVRVTQVDTTVPSLEPTKEYVLFLRQDKGASDNFVDVNAIAGTWELRGGAVVLPAEAEAYGETLRSFRGMAAEEMIRQLP